METNDYLEFIETTGFSKARKELMQEDEFQEFQSYLLKNHEDGDTISNTGGCKKIRWSRPGMGKQGGVRIIYYVKLLSGRLYLLSIYPKNVKADLTDKEKAMIKAISQKIQ